MTIALSVERYRALIIKTRRTNRVLEKRQNVVIAGIGIYAFSFLLNTPKFLEMEMVEVNVTDSNTTEQQLAFTDLYNDYYLVLLYDNIFYNLLTVILPFLALSYLNLRIYFGLKKKLADYTGNERGVEMRTYTVLFAVVLVLVVCHCLRVYIIMKMIFSIGEPENLERWANKGID